MGSNLVLLYNDDGIFSVYMLSRNFELISDCSESDFFIEFWSGKEFFKVYIVRNCPECALTFGLQCLDPQTRDVLLARFSERVTNDIIDFILKGENCEKPFPIHDYIDDWYKFADDLTDDYLQKIVL